MSRRTAYLMRVSCDYVVTECRTVPSDSIRINDAMN